MIAEVYVEVPVQNVNRPFDYIIPEKWQSIIVPGVRVVVPFGSRKLLGFVSKIKSVTDSSKLKEIEGLLDIQPVLTDELLELGETLATETVCTTIAAFQVMLPAALKGKYEKNIIVAPNHSALECSEEVQKLFENKQKLVWEEIEKSDLFKQIKSEIQKGILEIELVVDSKMKVKKERFIRSMKSPEELQVILNETRKNAIKQRKLLEFFIENEDVEIESAELVDQLEITYDVLNGFAKNGILKIMEIEQYRDPLAHANFTKTEKLQLTQKQAKVLHPIVQSIQQNTHKNFLLYGVTGSGKTEVYLQAIDVALQGKKQAIMLVPEISLTPQMVTRFKSRFGDRVAVLHSGLSNGEKYDEWRKIVRGEVSVVVGARSAIFAPFKKLGIIIIDEEHEGSYKQEETPRYHARDIAIKRGNYHGCPVVMGSATPSLESFARAKKGVYSILELGSRVNEKALPKVTVVDMREELRNGNRSMFSMPLYEKIGDRLRKKEQIVLLLNRRGHSSFMMCRDCGYVLECPNCDVSLTYHKHNHQMKCHYCGYDTSIPNVCPKCKSDHMRFFGTGTQKVEEEIARLYSNARVIRMDVDTTRTKGAHEKLLNQFENGQADILLGTQMIAKGLDYPNITLVGVLAADTSLHIADFRAAERTFQLLTQVSGRAGRHELEGEVVVQTYTPEHFAIELAAEHDYDHFYEREMIVRRKTGFSPYFFMTLINVSHEDLMTTMDAARKVCAFVRNGLSDKALVYGPTPASIGKVNNRYRYQCLIKYKNEPNLLNVLHELNEQFGLSSGKQGVYLTIDMNPNSML
ncbi:MAG: priA [Bacillales bacterium]|jgi:primosomal protein N' (replication factor Y)|nr:priA [Bacillales bacterium]